MLRFVMVAMVKRHSTIFLYVGFVKVYRFSKLCCFLCGFGSFASLNFFEIGMAVKNMVIKMRRNMGAVFPRNIVMRVSSICKGRLAYLRKLPITWIIYVDQASVVRRSDNTIHWINLYLVNNVLLSLIRWIATQNEFSFLLPNPLLLYMLLVTMCHLDNE